MRCEVCGTEIQPDRNSIVCSEGCNKVRLQIHKLIAKYCPTPGCDNCWGDLHQGCTEKCRSEHRAAFEFSGDLWELVKLVHSEP